MFAPMLRIRLARAGSDSRASRAMLSNWSPACSIVVPVSGIPNASRESATMELMDRRRAAAFAADAPLFACAVFPVLVPEFGRRLYGVPSALNP